ncbi:MAG: hypothetical protein NVSMB13_08460 [Mycobacteriales bacterium]
MAAPCAGQTAGMRDALPASDPRVAVGLLLLGSLMFVVLVVIVVSATVRRRGRDREI